MSRFRVLLITDPAYDVVSITRAALAGVRRGDVAVMVRDKSATARQLAALARALLPICRARGAPLLVNERCDVARAVGTDGAHLPERGLSVADARAVLGPGALIGASRHGPDEGEAADYVVLGPVGDVPGKARAMGLSRFAAACSTYSVPVYALGGVDAAGAAALIEGGARGVAVIRAVYASSDPPASLAALIQAVPDPGT